MIENRLHISANPKLQLLKKKGYRIRKSWFENHVLHVWVFPIKDERKSLKLRSLCNGLNIRMTDEKAFTTKPLTRRCEWYSLHEIKRKFTVSPSDFRRLQDLSDSTITSKPIRLKGRYVMKSAVEKFNLKAHDRDKRWKSTPGNMFRYIKLKRWLEQVIEFFVYYRQRNANNHKIN